MNGIVIQEAEKGFVPVEERDSDLDPGTYYAPIKLVDFILVMIERF